jgi:hypothetical protein
MHMAAKDTTPKSEWDELPPALEMPNTLGATVAKKDVLTTVPEPIRIRAEANLAINTQRVAAKDASNATRPRVDYYWDCQPVKDEDQGKRFSASLVDYAKYRPADVDIPHRAENSPKGQITARPQAPAFYVIGSTGKPVACLKDTPGAFLGVRYSVRPFEQGKGTNRLPGTV